MRRIFGFSGCLCTSALALFLASGCGQSEGERCQIDSDCASGLKCLEGSSGNGTCTPNSTAGTTNDASLKQDALVTSGPEVTPIDDAQAPIDVTSDVTSVLPDAAVSSTDTTSGIDTLGGDVDEIDAL
jgi:hypothetical protein